MILYLLSIALQAMAIVFGGLVGLVGFVALLTFALLACGRILRMFRCIGCRNATHDDASVPKGPEVTE